MILTTAGLMTFVIATFAVLATPGVTVSVVTGTTLSHGIPAGMAMELGAGLGRISMVTVLALGLSAVSEAMLFLFDWVKLAGAAYLIWIGIKTIRHPPQFDPQSGAAPDNFWLVARGFLVLWSNPKALIFFGAFVPQFIDPASDILPQTLVVGLIWVGIGAFTDTCYILLSGGARHLFRGAFAKRLGIVSGSILIGAGVWLALQRKA